MNATSETMCGFAEANATELRAVEGGFGLAPAVAFVVVAGVVASVCMDNAGDGMPFGGSMAEMWYDMTN